MMPISIDDRSRDMRIAILCRRFFPTSNDSSLRLLHLANGLRNQGAKAVVVTPRWHSTWPKRVTVEETMVERLEGPPINQLQQSQFRRSITDWLDVNAPSLDCIYVDEPGVEAITVSKHRSVCEARLPVVVRFDPLEINTSQAQSATQSLSASQQDWQPSQSVLDSCVLASRVHVPRPSSQQMLLRFGIPAQQIKVISDWNARSIDRTPASIREARRSLAEINSDLGLNNQQRLVIVPGTINAAWNLQNLVRAISPVLDRIPNLKVWIHGDGQEREAVYDLLQFFGHHRNVAMPGVVTTVSTLIQAADLLLFPSPTVGHSWLIPSALISGVPSLIADSAELKWQLGHLSSSISFRSDSANDLQNKLDRWWKDPADIATAARSAGQLIRRQFSSQNVWDELLALAAQFRSSAAHPPMPRTR